MGIPKLRVYSFAKIYFNKLTRWFLPVVTYVLWGIRRFLIKAFFIFHEKVLQYWVQDFCDSLSNKIIKKDYLSKLENFEGEVIGQFRKEIIQKVENFPPFFQKVTKYILNKVGINNDLGNYIKLVKNGNSKEISKSLNTKITEIIFDASKHVFPFWVPYLIPINTILFILLWFV